MLDEVHTYAGAQASEVALLLRKLWRLKVSAGQVRCIGTSASLARGTKAEGDIVRFAGDLFGTKFTRVIRGQREQHALLQAPAADPFKLPAAAWAALGHALSGTDKAGDEVLASLERRRRQPGNPGAAETTADASAPMPTCRPSWRSPSPPVPTCDRLPSRSPGRVR